MSKVLNESREGILIISINRPSVKNAIDHETANLLAEAFMDFDHNDDYTVAILTGVEGSFCSGADLKSIAQSSEHMPQLELAGNAPLGVSRMRLSKPVIAAVEGYAVAGGLELALWCDLRVASADAVFGVLCRRFGVPLVDGGTIRLPRLIGQSNAMDMILTGREVHAEEAKQMGLANRVCSKGESVKVAYDLAKKISAFPQTCMRSDRLSVLEQWDMSEKEALINESKRGIQVLASGESFSGANRFISGQF